MIYSTSPEEVKLDKIIDAVSKHCSEVNLKGFEENDEMIEAFFFVVFENFHQLNETKNALQKLNKSKKISILDNSGIV